jgi:uncharacterized membrane protein
MNFAIDTAVLCFLGWAAHWFASWGEAWKNKRMTLVDFIEDNPPAFWFSLTITLAVYLIGPSGLAAIGVILPPSLANESIGLLAAFLAGYVADSIVYKVANLARK